MIKSVVARTMVACGLVAAALIAWLFTQAPQPQTLGTAQTQQVGNLHVTLQLDGTDVGTRIIDLDVRDQANRPVDLRGVHMRLSMRDMDMGTTEVEAREISRGHYQVRAVPFGMVGAWNIETTLVQADQTNALVRFAIGIAAPGEQAGAVNPLAANPQAILAGQQLYRANCVACHGQYGRGDGPSAAGLKPRPADFSQHMLPGKHADGQVFLWIADGYPGSAMPAWRKRLDEQQIWQLVSYLRTFGQPAVMPIATFAPAQAVPTAPRSASPPPSTLTPLPRTNEQLPPMVFAREGNIWHSDGQGQITALTQLGDEQYAQDPTYSPDGAQIAYVVVSPAPITATLPLPKSALYLMNADGSAATRVLAPAQGLLSLPSWSPDGRTLYLAANGIDEQQGADGADTLQVVRFDLASRSTSTVFRSALDPTLSHDGTQLAYLELAADGYTMDLHVAAPDGSNDRLVLNGAQFQGLYAPRFSPDGLTIYFAAIGGSDGSANGTPTSMRDTQPRTRPGPAELLLAMLGPATAEAHGLPWDVWSVRSDGSGLRRLTNIYEDLPMVAPAPDGRQIAIMGYNGIYLSDPDGTHLRQISTAGDHGGLDWQP